MNCIQAECLSPSSQQTSEHKYLCSVVPKCSHCKTRTDIEPIVHEYSCPECPKCAHCKTRTDIEPVVHNYSCPECPKCEYCKTRMDYLGCHRSGCPNLQFCVCGGRKNLKEHKSEFCIPFVAAKIELEKVSVTKEHDCPICYEEKADIRTQCGHFFHSKCLGEWVIKNKICPMCRTEIYKVYV